MHLTPPTLIVQLSPDFRYRESKENQGYKPHHDIQHGAPELERR
jgi:hypothetical protein